MPKRDDFPDDKKYERKSTGFKNYKEAERWALDHLDDLKRRWRGNEPLKDKLFSEAYEEYLKEQRALLASHEFTENKITRIETTYKNHLKSFFGHRTLREIDKSLLDEYIAERLTKGGIKGNAGGIEGDARRKETRPSHYTVNRENSVLRGIFQLALTNRYILQIPKIRYLSSNSVPRSHFDTDQWELIIERLTSDVEQLKAKAHPLDQETYKARLMLKTLVQLIGYSGIRAGRESNQNLKWEHIKVVVQEKGKLARYPIAPAKNGTYNPDNIVHVEILVTHVKHQTKPRRNVVALPWIESPLRNWRAVTDFAKETDFVFAHQEASPNLKKGMEPGHPVKSLRKQFKEFLRANKLLVDGNGKNRTLTSCRHSYATFRLTYTRITPMRLVTNMGTSIEMLNRTYSHLIPTDVAESLAEIPANMKNGG